MFASNSLPPPSHYGTRTCNVISVSNAWPNRFRYGFLPPGNRRTGAEMEWSLGSFGDLRLDKGGARSSNGWSRARRYACAGWVVTVVAKSERAGSSPTQKPAPAKAGGDGGEGWSLRTSAAVAGRHILAPQD